MPEAVIVSAVRTPIGAHGGALAAVRPDDLAALVIAEAARRAGVDPGEVEEVYLGCANQAGEDNRNVARMAVLLAGFPVHVAGVTFNRLCASGLQAVNAAARAIKAGEGEVYIAGGVESMSRAPYSVPKADKAFRLGQPDRLGYDARLALPEPAHRSPVRDRFDGRDGGEHLRPAAVDHASGPGRLRRREPPPRRGGHRFRPLRRGDRPGADPSTQRRSRVGDDRRAAAARHDDRIARPPQARLPRRRIGDRREFLRTQRRGGGAGVDERPQGRRPGAHALGARRRLGRRRRRAAPDGPRSGARHAQGAAARRPRAAGHPPGRAERSLRRPVAGRPAGPRPVPGDHQRQRRRHRPRPSAGLFRGAHPDHAAARDAPPRSQAKARPYFGLAALCVGVGQGEATIVEWIGA